MTKWDSEKLYYNNDAFFQDLIAELELAQHQIDLEVFIFEQGKLAQRLVDTLARACRRGVKVRVICDSWGSPRFNLDIGPELRKAGVRIKIYRPLPWKKIRTRGEPRFFWRKLWRRLLRINKGAHRKVVIIDKAVAWVSSMNISDLHLTSVYGKNAWQDIGARVEGQEIRVLSMAFDKAFYARKRLKYIPRPKTNLVLVNDSFLRRRRATYVLNQRLLKAQHRIWLQNPYFVPHRKIVRTLFKRAEKGVDVRIILPEKNDQPIVKWMSYAIWDRLIKSGVKIYQYQGPFVHRKVQIVDQTYAIGSYNLNHRSFFHDLEVEIKITSYENHKRMVQAFLADQNQSRLITLEELNQRNLWYRILTRILFFFRYWC